MEHYPDIEETKCPHSPDTLERETSDGGFSSGWGNHFKPAETHWIDTHSHIQFVKTEETTELLESYLRKLSIHRVKQIVACLPLMITRTEKENDYKFILATLSELEELKPYFISSQDSVEFSTLLFLNYSRPDVDLLVKSIKYGACGVKLHNASIIIDNADPKVWLNDEWKKVFSVLEEKGLPVLWHVAQRLTAAAYAGGGRNSYWKEGWEKGVKFTNEDLFKVFIEVVERYPGINFIGAHQLHMGWDRICKLFEKYNNFYVDTSIGCIVRRDDILYEADKDYFRSIFIRYSDRILFGTDLFITDNESDLFYMTDSETDDKVSSHIRFIRQLDLPDDVLQKISHSNAEKMYSITLI